jgi:hypothetical protein
MFVSRKTRRRSEAFRTTVRRRAGGGRRLTPSLEGLEARTVLSTVSWTNPAGGDWNTATNWSTGVVPNFTQDAMIAIPVSNPIVIDSANAVNSLTDSTASLELTGGSLSLAATSSVGENVTISSGAVLTSAGNLTVGGTLNQSSGVLTGAGTVTVNGLLTWTGGAMSGPGTTVAAGGLQLGLDGKSSTESLDARTLQNAGSATWTSTDILTQNAHSLFQNLAHATLTVQSGATLTGTGTLDNQGQGMITVAAGTGTASFGTDYTNEGNLEVSSGTLFMGGSGSLTGNTVVDAGATLQFGGTQYNFNLGAGVTGQGTVTFGAPFTSPATTFESGSAYSFSGATIVQDGAIVVFDATASTSTLNESSGVIGGSGTLTVATMATWTGGTMSGSGITQCLGGLSLGASGDTGDSETLAGRMLINAGAGVLYGPDRLTLGEDSTFLIGSSNPGPNPTLQFVGGGTVAAATLEGLDATSTFENNGAITVADGTASTVVVPDFVNSGTVEVASGTLHLGGGGASPWSALAVSAGFTVDSGATLELAGDSGDKAYTFNPKGYINGAGAVDFASGAAATFANGATYNVTGTTDIKTGSVAVDITFTPHSTVGSLGALTITTGVLNLSTGSTSPIPVSSMTMSSGTLTGSDTVGVTGLLTWTGGVMEGAGSTVAAGGLDLGSSGGTGQTETLEARTLVNEGTATWVGANAVISLLAGSTFLNHAGASFTQDNGGTIQTDFGTGLAPSGVFDNEGAFVVAGGGTMEAALNDGGTVEVVSGQWTLSGYGSATGTITLDAGSTLVLNTHYGIQASQILGATPSNVTPTDGNMGPTPYTNQPVIPLPTAPFTSFYIETGSDTVGSLTLSGGWLTVQGTLTITGTFTWTGGYIAGPGTVIVEGQTQLGSATGTQQVLYGATLINEGTITEADQDNFSQEDGATIENQGGTITMAGDAQWGGDGGATLDNTGVIQKTAGSGTATFHQFTLVNDGAVTVSSGTLDLNMAGTATGGFTAASGSTLIFEGYTWAFNPTSSVKGAGTVDFDFDPYGFAFNANATYNVTGATQLQSQSDIDFVDGSHAQNFGALTITNGTLQLDSGSADSVPSLTLSGGVLTGSDPLTVSGATTWTAGVMSGTGSTVADGPLELGKSGDTPTAAAEDLTVRTLDVNGSGTTGGGTLEPLDTLVQSYGSTFVNTATDTLDVLGGVNWESSIDNTASIVNQGALVVGAVVAGTAINTATISGGANFDFLTCPGAISVLSGTLDLASNGTATGTLQASFSVFAGCTLQFGGDFTLGVGAGIGGPGTLEVPGRGDLVFTPGASSNFVGTATIDGGTIEYDDSAQAGTLNLLSGGDLTGTGTLTVTGPAVWSGGTMDGPGTTIAQDTLQLGQANVTLSGRTLVNAGTATWAGAGSINQLYGSTFANEVKASFTIDNDLTWTSDRTGTFANAGTLTKAAGSGTTTLQTVLDNTGSVVVQQGTLSLQGGSVVGGTYLVQAGATLKFGSDNVTPTSVAVPSDFTDGTLDWVGTFSGSAQDNSGSGLASVGVSLFDGKDYYNGTAFQSPTAAFNAAALSGTSWTYSIPTTIFTSDLAYAAGTEAMDNKGGNEPSSITTIRLAILPTVTMTAPASGTITINTMPTLTATASSSTRGSGVASVQFQYSSDGGTTWTSAGTPETAAPFSYTFTTALALGTYEAHAIVTDNAGNTTTSAPVSFTISAVAPTTITATAGTPQSATVSTAFATALQATVKDQNGNPFPGATVTFTAPDEDASGTFPGGLTTVTAMTNASGIATAPTFTANSTAGDYEVTASVAGVATHASFSLTNNPLVATTITATAGTPQSATVSTAFATALQATVKDQNGNPFSGATVTFTAPTSGASGTFPGSLTTVTATTNASGVATAPTFTANSTAGGYTVTASVAGVATPASFSLTNNPLVSTTITATAGTPQSATVTTAFTTALQATVKDQNGNPFPGATVTFTAPTSGASGTFPGSLTTVTAMTNASGVATAPAFTANSTAGGYTVTASVTGVATSASFSLTNNPLVATTIAATTGTPQSATVSTAFATALQATVDDQNGNPFPGATVTFTAPTSGAGGTFPGGLTTVTATTNASGVATAPTFTANGTAGGYTVTASVAGVATSASFSLTNTAAVPASIQLANPTFTANVTDGTLVIGLTRAGNLSATVTVVVSSPGGHDVAAFQQTVTFGPNATTASVTVPIQDDGKPGESDVSIPVSLSSAGAGATLGATTSATLVVHDNHALPPVVTVASFQPTTVKITTGTGKRQKTKSEPGLLLGFGGNLTGTGSSAAYQLLTGKTRKGVTTYNKSIPLTVFNATPTSVTLVPSGKPNLSQPLELKVKGAALTDAFGRPLDGGQNFTLTFGSRVVTSAQLKSQSQVGALSAPAVDAVFAAGLVPALRPAR